MKNQAPKKIKMTRDSLPEPIHKAYLLLQSYCKSQGASLLLFGSRARGSARRNSDWDFAIYFFKPYDYSEILELKTQIEDLSFPWEINLVLLNESPSWFYASIEEDLQLLQGPSLK